MNLFLYFIDLLCWAPPGTQCQSWVYFFTSQSSVYPPRGSRSALHTLPINNFDIF